MRDQFTLTPEQAAALKAANQAGQGTNFIDQNDGDNPELLKKAKAAEARVDDGDGHNTTGGK